MATQIRVNETFQSLSLATKSPCLGLTGYSETMHEIILALAESEKFNSYYVLVVLCNNSRIMYIDHQIQIF